jgi:hypothetical protein
MENMTKKEYLASLRNRWNLAREAVGDEFLKYSLEHIEALKLVPSMSPTGFMFVKLQMNMQKLEGTPGIDARTFDGWKKA